MRAAHLPTTSLALVASVALVACGGAGNSGGGSPKPTALSVKITGNGKATSISAPKSTKGGLVEMKVTNAAKSPLGAQLVLIKGNHTPAEVLKTITGNSSKTPAWFRAIGGVGTVAPGQSATATMNLPAGKYVLVGSSPMGPTSAHASLSVTTGQSASLPRTPANVTAEHVGKDRYQWKISGLKGGTNKITFASKGPKTVHLVDAVRVTGNPSLAKIKAGLKSNGKPPSFVDLSSLADTAVLDGGRSETTSLHLRPGRYVFFCPLTDRDGGKPHFEEGLLTKVTVP